MAVSEGVTGPDTGEVAHIDDVELVAAMSPNRADDVEGGASAYLSETERARLMS
jgi:hypothetical protein